MQMKKILSFFLMLFVWVSMYSQPKYEIRASWITTLGGMDWPRQKARNAAGIQRQKDELRQILDRLKAGNFNTVLLQTRLRGDMIYPSSIEGFAEALTGTEGRNPGYDPLAFAIEECHKRGMELHAWIVTIPIGNDRQVSLAGRNSVVRKQRSLCKHYQGSWYLDPGNPGTKDYLSRIVKEVVNRYDVDGIHFDYIRYPENARNFPDGDTFRRYGNGKSLQQWRRDNVTAIVRQLYADIKALKPWVKVSSSPIGKYDDTNRYPSRGWNALNTVYQDAQQWLREGIHDALFPMMYFKDNQFYPFALDWEENREGRWVVPGLGAYFLAPSEGNWPLSELVRQISFSREIGLNGQAYFRNRFLMDNTKQLWDELTEDFYAYPAVVPPMTWMDNVPPSVPAHPVMDVSRRGEITFGWSTSTDNHQLPVTYRLYASDNHPIDINDPHNIVATNIKDTHYLYQMELPWMQRRFYGVTAVDRFGNESDLLELNKASESDLPLLNEGNTVILPASTDIQYISILTPVGIEVLRLAYTSTFHIEQLQGGFYIVRTIDKDGRETTIGAILK